VRTTASIDTAEAFEARWRSSRRSSSAMARVTLTLLRRTSLRANGKLGLGIGIDRQAKSNTLEISTAVRRVAELNETLPSSIYRRDVR
jgi:HAE1 family hydrophobic/amphiphilic exporter-1